MADPTPISALTFANTMLVKYQTLLSKCAGMKLMEVDGLQVRYEELEKAYNYWENRVARLSGARPLSSSVRLDKPGGATSAQQVGPL